MNKQKKILKNRYINNLPLPVFQSNTLKASSELDYIGITLGIEVFSGAGVFYIYTPFVCDIKTKEVFWKYKLECVTSKHEEYLRSLDLKNSK